MEQKEMCDVCNGTGIITYSIPAHEKGGEIKDEETYEVICYECNGKGYITN